MSSARRVVQDGHQPLLLQQNATIRDAAQVSQLLCTAGFPAVYTHVLTAQELPAWKNYAYLGLYNLAYIVDDGLMVGLAVVTLSRRKLQERESRWLKLISGAVMLALALVLFFKPAWLAALG